MNCNYCKEPVLDGEQSPIFQVEPMHVECGFRMSGGSVAHVLRLCSCFVKGSKLTDPPGLTARQAARAALDLFRQVDIWFPGEGE